MEANDAKPGLVHACVLDGQGGATFGGWELLRAWQPDDGVLWVHLDPRTEDARGWLQRDSGLDPVASAALLARASRPRSVVRGDTLLVNLRGVNLNPGAQPDDMIGVRVELEGRRIITVRQAKLKSLAHLRRALEQGRGPTDTGSFLIDLIDQLLVRMIASFEALDDRIDAVHERIDTAPGAELRSEISDIRNQVIRMRRYLAPQREAVARLQSERVSWLAPEQREQLRDLADRTTRRVEDLDEARDRAAVAHEELTTRMAESMNRTMYVLAIITAVFLPLGLLTGLLGINVGGMPGVEDGRAFWIVCAVLVGVAGLQVWWFKRRDWF